MKLNQSSVSHTIVVINSAAGSVIKPESTAFRQQLQTLFKIYELKADIHWIEPADLPAALKQCQKMHIKKIIIGGGDGTVNTAANILADTSTVLGVLPLGTFNHFAQDLGIPLDLEKAVQNLARSTPRLVDVAEVNGRVFVNNASLGIYPYAVRRREIYQQQLGIPKIAAMGYALLNAFWYLPLFESRMIINEIETPIKSPFIFIGNNRYVIESFGIVQRRLLNEGQLSLFYTHRPKRLTLIKIACQSLIMNRNDIGDLEQIMAPTVVVYSSSNKSVKLTVDGEVITLPSPLHFCIRPQTLKVLCPN
jgi:diacylglycerol kinase family enzyme